MGYGLVIIFLLWDNMDIVIKELSKDKEDIKKAKDFLYGQIKKLYGIGPTPEFHYDIEAIDKYYICPQDSCFLMAYADNKIIATGAVRPYDMDYEFFKDYTKENTSSIWRLMVDEEYRRHGIGRKLVEALEKFSKDAGYAQIYLHTHRYLDSALAFWTSLGYEITLEEEDYDETTHMIKIL